jgi:hypothetical protein
MENHDNMYQWSTCPVCQNQVWLDYDEQCTDDFDECWEIWEWLKEEKDYGTK